MLQWSVVRFRVPILLVLTAAALGLGLWLARRWPVPGSRWLAPAVLVLSAALLWTVPLFSYLRGGWLLAAKLVLTVGALGAAALLARPSRYAVRTAYGLALLTQVSVATVAIVGDPAPRIDVWVVLQQASEGLLHGSNMYTAVWTGSPGVHDIFPYLPWTTVLLAPGRWLGGDVRWSLAVWSVLLLVGLWWLARGYGAGSDATHGQAAARAAAIASALVVVPGALTQVDQAWTEPLLAAGVVWWAVLVRRGHAWWAVLPLALACASKQHLAVFLPLLLLWRGFGARRAVATGGLAAVLIAPWVLASPADFVHDTVTTLISFHPIVFANTWYLFALNEYGVTLPFWLSGLPVLAALLWAAWTIHRRQPGLAELLRWLAFVLLIANLVNKQAFYNQFWLSAALVAASLVVPDDDALTPQTGSAGRARPATPA